MVHAQIFENRDLRSKPGCGWLPHDWLFAEGVKRSLRNLAAEGIDLGGYGEPKGYLPLRQLVRESLAEHEVVATAEQVLLTQGSSQALDLAARRLVRPATRCWWTNRATPTCCSCCASCARA